MYIVVCTRLFIAKYYWKFVDNIIVIIQVLLVDGFYALVTKMCTSNAEQQVYFENIKVLLHYFQLTRIIKKIIEKKFMKETKKNVYFA